MNIIKTAFVSKNQNWIDGAFYNKYFIDAYQSLF